MSRVKEGKPFIPPTLKCKYCSKTLEVTNHSKDLIEIRGPYRATYLYRCECTLHEVQVLPVSQYPSISRKEN